MSTRPVADRSAFGHSLDVAYVLWDYPIRSETFIQRELLGVQSRGVTPRLLLVAPRHGPDSFVSVGPTNLETRRFPGLLTLACWRAAVQEALGSPRSAARAATVAWRVTSEVRVHREDAFRIRLKGAARRFRWLVTALYFSRDLRPRRPDLIHAHFAGTPASVARIVAAALERPWGVSLHARDIYAEGRELSRALETASHVVTCSETAAEDVRHRLPFSRRGSVRCVHHGVDTEYWQRNAVSREPLGPYAASGPPWLIAVGRLEKKKGFEVLLRACAHLAGDSFAFRCAILGEGSERTSLLRLRHDLGLDGRVCLSGWADPAELRRWYARAAVLIVPSVIAMDGDRDNIPNVLLEGLSMGTPVVASSLPALRAVLQPANCALLVEPGDGVALARQIQRILGEPHLAGALAANGQRLARNQDQREMIGALASIFFESAHRGGAPCCVLAAGAKEGAQWTSNEA